MSFISNAIVTATISLAFIAPAGAQAPQAEKNVSMKMALMIIEGTLALKMAIKFPSQSSIRAAMSLRR